MHAGKNTIGRFALGNFGMACMDAILKAFDAHESMAKRVMTSERIREGVKRHVLELVYKGFKDRRESGEAA